MSQRNVELILATVGAYNAGNLDAWAEFLDADIEVFPDASFPESSPLSGRDDHWAWRNSSPVACSPRRGRRGR